MQLTGTWNIGQAFDGGPPKMLTVSGTLEGPGMQETMAVRVLDPPNQSDGEAVLRGLAFRCF